MDAGGWSEIVIRLIVVLSDRFVVTVQPSGVSSSRRVVVVERFDWVVHSFVYWPDPLVEGLQSLVDDSGHRLVVDSFVVLVELVMDMLAALVDMLGLLTVLDA